MEPGILRRRLVSVLALLTVMIAGTASSQLAAQVTSSSAQQGGTTIGLSLRAAAPEVGKVERPTGTFTSLTSEDILLGEEGAPALPVVREWVGVPSTAEPRISVNYGDALSLPTAVHPIDPMPTHYPVTDDPVESVLPDRLEAVYEPDARVYAQEGWYPASPLAISKIVTLRGQMMREVTLTTVQVNLQTGELRWFPTVEVQLEWAAEQVAPQLGAANDPHYEATFDTMLANYDQARAWRLPGEADSNSIELTYEMADGNTWMIRVRGKGLFKVPLNDLAAQGVDISAPERLALYAGDAQNIREQAIWISNGNLYFVNTQDHDRWSFDVVFRLKVLTPGQLGKRMQPFGGAPTYPTTLNNVPFETNIERELLYRPLDVSFEPGERWHWGNMIPPNQPNYSTVFDLPMVAPGSVYITPQIGVLVGPEYNGRCNSVTFGVNGTTINDVFYGPSSFEGTLVLPHTSVQPTGNAVEIQSALCGSTQINAILFGSLHIAYNRYLDTQGQDLVFNNVNQSVNYAVVGLAGSAPLVFEISDPDNVRRLGSPLEEPVEEQGNALSSANDAAVDTLADARSEPALVEEMESQGNITFGRAANASEQYLASSVDQAKAVEAITFYQSPGVIGTGIQVDYLVIGPDEFKSALTPLIQFRQSQGLSGRFVSTQQIYNDFGDGTAHPETIRAFIEYAYNAWPAPKISYVLLVGDSTYDPLDYLGTGDVMVVPALLEYRDAFLGEVPSDNEYVADLDGSTDDLPDAHIGRLPAKNVAHVQAMVDKLIRYEVNSAPGPWQRTLLFTTDNRDSAGDFDCLSEWIYQPPGYYCYGQGGNVYEGRGLVPQEAVVIPSYLPSAASSAQIMAVRDSIANYTNSGALIVQYIGHGSKRQWTNEGIWATRRYVSPGVFSNDIDLLSNVDRYPLVLPWTCWEGYFVDPMAEAIAEDNVRGMHGFIGSFSPVGLDVATAHDAMTEGLYEKLFAVHGGTPSSDLGALTLAAKAALVGGPSSFQRLIYTYLLLGDPATQLQVDECLQNDGVPCSGVRLAMPVVNR